MNNEKNTMQEAAYTSRVPQRVQGFDPTKYARETKDADGKKVLTLDLQHKKTWFRLACPNGGVVLNPLRVTDTMAIFEARVFADTGDGTPLASFTAARSADKATGKQYIRAAQEAALSEALENAGFDVRLCGAAPTQDSGRFTHVCPLGEGETVQKADIAGEPEKAADSGEPTVVPKQVKPVQPVQKNPDLMGADKRPVPVGPQPHGVADQPVQKTVGGPAQPSAAPVVDIATRQPVPAPTQPKEAAQRLEPPKAEPASASGPSPEASSSDVPPPDALPAYNADMTVDEICRVMTLEQAKAIKVPDGICKGWTLEQVAKDRAPSLKWLRFTSPFADNVLKAAAKIVLDDLELKLAG